MMFPLAKDIKCNLKTINRDAKRKKNRSNIVNQLSKFVRFHSRMIELSHVPFIAIGLRHEIEFISFSSLFRLIQDHANFSQMILIMIFSWSMAGICTIMLMLNMRMVKISLN